MTASAFDIGQRGQASIESAAIADDCRFLATARAIDPACQ